SSGGADLLRVFSSNADPFEAGRAYGKFRAYALLNHGGDLSAAARELRRQGYGSRSSKDARAGPAASQAGTSEDASFADSLLPRTEPEWPQPLRPDAYHGHAPEHPAAPCGAAPAPPAPPPGPPPPPPSASFPGAARPLARPVARGGGAPPPPLPQRIRRARRQDLQGPQGHRLGPGPALPA